MGVPPGLRDAFLDHPWYSPRRKTVLVESLAGIDTAADRAASLEAALSARSEADALFFQHAAELLRAYHDGAARVERMLAVAGAACGRDAGAPAPAAADADADHPLVQVGSGTTFSFGTKIRSVH